MSFAFGIVLSLFVAGTAIAESRREHGLHDRDEVMPNGQTFAEYVESSRVPALFSDAEIDAPRLGCREQHDADAARNGWGPP